LCWDGEIVQKNKKMKYLVPLAKGGSNKTFCLSQEAGSDATSQKRQQLMDDHYLLNGTKLDYKWKYCINLFSNSANRC
jgi:hypothetical protein